MTRIPIPIFGIGAWGSASTWLQQRLRLSGDCALAPLGAVHFFDTRYGLYSACANYIRMSDRLQKLARSVSSGIAVGLAGIESGSKGGSEDGADLAEADVLDEEHLVAFTDEIRSRFFRNAAIDEALREIGDVCAQLSIIDTQSYVRYMAGLSAGAAAYGEVCPSYGRLPARAFAEIDSLFPQAQFVFIMQDPVERLWSHIRSITKKPDRFLQNRLDWNRQFRRALDRPALVELSDYRRTIGRLESAIPRSRIHYFFYESLVSPQSGPAECRRLEIALGLAPATNDQTQPCRELDSPAADWLDRKSAAAAMRLFEPSYDFIRSRFGCPKSWYSPEQLPCSDAV